MGARVGDDVSSEDYLAQITAEIVAPAFLAMALVYLLNANAAPWFHESNPHTEQRRILHWCAFAVFLVGWLMHRRRGVRPEAANAWLLSIVATVAAVNSWELLSLGDPAHGFYLTVTAFAVGYGFLSVPWFLAALAVLSSAWILPLASNWPLPD